MHQPYDHVERLAELRHADLVAAGAQRRRAAARAESVGAVARSAVPSPQRVRRRVVIAGTLTAALLTAGTAYAAIAAPEPPARPEPADSLVVGQHLRAV